MIGTRLKVFAIWGGLLFLVTQFSAVALIAALGQTNGLILTIPLAVFVAGFAGYQAANALKKYPEYKKKNALTIVGATTAFFAAFLSGAVNYFLTGQISFGAGLFTLVAAAVGGYLVERQNK